jgi:uncharacterized protein YecT (DUF1311 family)
MQLNHRNKHRRKTLASLAALAFSSAILWAEVSSTAAQPQIDCANPTSNIEYKECAHRAYVASDKKLNQVYRQVVSTLAAKEKQHLIDAQLAWIKYRDSNCDFEIYQSLGGTGYGGFLSNCLERMTNARTKELQNWQKERANH